MFSAWMLGKNPSGAVMRNSYSELLAYKFSYDVRGMVSSDKYHAVFPDIKMSSNKGSVTGWNLETAKQVSYFCAGVGGSITGFGCDLLAILDDPIKNIEEAMSENVLEKKWDWFTSTHNSRIEEGCSEIHIATRWSKNDIIGKLKEQNYFDYSIEIPALINEKSYCEENITTERLFEIKSLTEGAIFESVYQQTPIETTGTLFPADQLNWFTMEDIQRKPDSIVAVCDGADEGTDYLSLPVGYVYGQKIYIVDVVFTQSPVEVTENEVAAKLIEHNVQSATFESNSGGKIYAQNVQKCINGYSKCYINWKQTTTNKDTRIFVKSGAVKRDFYFRKDSKRGNQYDRFINQLTSYVAGGKNIHDDAPDSVTMMSELFETVNNYWA
jgi:predicted phage terminase large subunit-like protein